MRAQAHLFGLDKKLPLVCRRVDFEVFLQNWRITTQTDSLYYTNKCLKALAYHLDEQGCTLSSLLAFLYRSATLLRSLEKERQERFPLKVSFGERSLSYYPYLWIVFYC